MGGTCGGGKPSGGFVTDGRTTLHHTHPPPHGKSMKRLGHIWLYLAASSEVKGREEERGQGGNGGKVGEELEDAQEAISFIRLRSCAVACYLIL